MSVAKLAVPLVLASVLLAAGAQAQTVPTPGATQKAAHGNWTVNCKTDGKKVCVASLRISHAGSKKIALLWQIGENADGEATYVIRTPLGVRLKDGVRIALDGGKPQGIGFLSCNERGCTAVGTFKQDLAKRLAGATEAVVSFTLVDGQAVDVPVPLGGIDKALAALRG